MMSDIFFFPPGDGARAATPEMYVPQESNPRERGGDINSLNLQARDDSLTENCSNASTRLTSHSGLTSNQSDGEIRKTKREKTSSDLIVINHKSENCRVVVAATGGSANSGACESVPKNNRSLPEKADSAQKVPIAGGEEDLEQFNLIQLYHCQLKLEEVLTVTVEQKIEVESLKQQQHETLQKLSRSETDRITCEKKRQKTIGQLQKQIKLLEKQSAEFVKQIDAKEKECKRLQLKLHRSHEEASSYFDHFYSESIESQEEMIEKQKVDITKLRTQIEEKDSQIRDYAIKGIAAFKKEEETSLKNEELLHELEEKGNTIEELTKQVAASKEVVAQLEQNLKTEKDRADRVQDEYERDKEKWSKQKEGTMNMVMQKSDTIPTSSSMQKQQRKSPYEHVGRQLTGDHNEDNENFEETKKQNKKKSRFWQLSGKQKRAKTLDEYVSTPLYGQYETIDEYSAYATEAEH